MSRSASLLYSNFRLAGEEESIEKPKNRSRAVGDFTGDQAKGFYESIIADSNNDGAQKQGDVESVFQRAVEGERTARRARVKAKKRQETVDPSQLLPACQNCDCSTVSKILSAGIHNQHVTDAVLGQDAFGWTPLMVASVAGSADIVGKLLDYYDQLSVHYNCVVPWKSCTDKKGRNALHLAEIGEHPAVIKLLTEHEPAWCDGSSSGHSQLIDESPASVGDVILRCDLCREEFRRADHDAHLASTVHQLNSREHSGDNPPTVYAVPSHNPGYQLMVRNGWNPERGLGPREDGRKLPIRTTLKRSRAGFGSRTPRKELEKRITHSHSFEEDNVRHRQRPKPVRTAKTKQEMRREAEHSRRKEISWRKELSGHSF